MEKKTLRDAMRRLNRAMPANERAEASERIFRQVEALPEFAAAHCVALYCALGDEPDTQAALERWCRSKRLVVPRVESEGMQFYAYDPSAMVQGAFGITEPGPAAKRCPPEEIDLAVVPGVAFTEAGARMGRGGGYYDRYFAQTGVRAFRVGVCYAHQLVAQLPVEPHDLFMDQIIGE